MASFLVTGTPFEWQASATGGTPPYTWSATGLPTGIAINSSTGLISGTPTAAGTFNATITVQDSTTATANDTASFTVQAVPVASPHYAFVEKAAALVRQWGALIAAVPTAETMAGLTRQWGSITSPPIELMAGLTRQWGSITSPPIELMAGLTRQWGSMTTPATGLNANLIGWWKFNNNLNDESSNNTPLVQLGSGTPSYVVAAIDQALDNAQNAVQCIQTSSVDNLHTSGFYIAMVFEVSSYANFNALIAKSDGTSSSDPQFVVRHINFSSTLNLLAFDGSSVVANANLSRPAVGGYNLLEIYFDPTIGSFGEVGIALNNGSFVTASLTNSMASGTGTSKPLAIGGIYDSSKPNDNDASRFFDGNIDLFAVWDTVFSDLSPTGPERADLWNSGNFRADP